MADTKITGLTGYTPPIDTDVLPIVDITTTTTKKITWANIKLAITSLANLTSAVLLPWTGMKPGTDGEIPTFDASGNPAFVAVGTATHILTSNGAGAAPTFQAAAGGGADTSLSNLVANEVVFTKTVTVTTANITGMFATPIEVIAAVAGAVIVIDQVLWSFTAGGTQFTSGGQTKLLEGSAGFWYVRGIDESVINSASNSIHETVTTVTETLQQVRLANTGIYLTNATGAFATGNGSFKMYIRYRLVTL